MRSRTFRNAASATAVLLLLVAIPVFQPAYAGTSQSLSLTATGGVVDLGDQKYAINGGAVSCPVCFVAINGQFFASSTKIEYQLAVQVVGQTVSGSAQFHLAGMTVQGVKEVVEAKITIDDMVPAVIIGNSVLPFFLVGPATVRVTSAGSSQTFQTVLQMENPYFNPFGNPIIVGSVDNSVTIVMTYSQATILWDGSVVSGAASGTLGTATAVSGVMTLVSSESEDLVEGIAVDHGTLSFSSMSPSFLDVSGEYHGGSMIPQAGAIDCSGLTGLPGTCTQTGFQSAGQFTTHNDAHVHIDGSYATQWGVPALGFQSQVTATVRP